VNLGNKFALASERGEQTKIKGIDFLASYFSIQSSKVRNTLFMFGGQVLRRQRHQDFEVCSEFCYEALSPSRKGDQGGGASAVGYAGAEYGLSYCGKSGPLRQDT